MVMEKYMGFMDSVFSRVEKMDANEKAWWKAMVVPIKGTVMSVVGGLLVQREAAN